jgi:hypothetical protein
MSLKAVHLVFVSALSGLAFGCGLWQARLGLSPGGMAGNWLMAVLGFLGGVAIILYGRYFLKKLKSVSYL